jgi:hypothetical protein
MTILLHNFLQHSRSALKPRSVWFRSSDTSKTALDFLLLESAHTDRNPISVIEDKTTHGFAVPVSAEDTNWHNLFPFDLSDTQKKIVLTARRNNLSVVSGPPGTGKSYTIAAIILDHLLGGKRVLFVSRMDKAVDVVSKWLEEFVGPYAVARAGARKAQRALADKLEAITGPNSGSDSGSDPFVAKVSETGD